MAEEAKTPAKSSRSSSSSAAAPAAPTLGGPTGDSFADVQGEYLTPDDPVQTAGTSEHLGSERPYAGGEPE